ncbi:hypothetical protein [Bosea sp. (in: a-proteobacteria)]|jgi:hypothetical protein|uniref:hypothetical protein n=1 Tax=Bosea sp. (in: a-proteobacteria) TaxID=1871050 RepID=UPI003F70F36C
MTSKPVTIRNDAELTAALARADALMGRTGGREEERELETISDAIKVYTDAMRVLRKVRDDPHQTSEFASDD